MYFLNLLRKLLNLTILVMPLMLSGIVIEPFLPAFNFATAVIIWVFAVSFGFLLMVNCSANDQNPGNAQKLNFVGKGAFLILCPVAVGGILRHAPFDISLFFALPLFLIAAKTFFDMNIQNILEDLYNSMWD